MDISLTNRATDPPSIRVTLSAISGDIAFDVWRVSATGTASHVVSVGAIGPADPYNLNITPPQGEGVYLVAARDDDGTTSLVSTVATKGDKAVLTRVRAAVKAHILTLGLPLVDVYEQWTPDDSETDFPCIVLTHQNTGQTNEQAVVGTKDIGHPVRVMICDRASKYEHDRMPDYDWWRQKVWDAFDNKRLPGVPECLECKVEPDLLSDAESVPFSLMVSQLVIRVTTREPSGY